MVATGQQAAKARLNREADRIEAFFRSYHIPVRVLGGMVRRSEVRFRVSAGVSPERLGQFSHALARLLGVSHIRVAQEEGYLVLESPRIATPPPVWLVRLQAQLPPLLAGTAVLGRDEDDAPLLLRFFAGTATQVVISGMTAAGKTCLLRALTVSLALAGSPEEVRFLLADASPESKSSGLNCLTGLLHIIYNTVLRTPAQIEARLQWLLEEVAWREGAAVCSPSVVLCCDNAEYVARGGTRSAQLLATLATRGGAVGVHLVLGIGNPAALASELWPLFSCRIVGRVPDSSTALLASGIPKCGAEGLAGQGHFLLVQDREVTRFQAGYVTVDEVQALRELLQEDLVAQQKQEQARRVASAAGMRRDRGTGGPVWNWVERHFGRQ